MTCADSVVPKTKNQTLNFEGNGGATQSREGRKVTQRKTDYKFWDESLKTLKNTLIITLY
jgi:hypothetical protein